ncbi:MAG: phosphoadenosine phosphosulfate reductase family protein, partial [Acidobacteriota bacterium]|nr:phosphoadenosine phosphosulfate reductase family protein [Acidobacteriota bacterium]
SRASVEALDRTEVVAKISPLVDWTAEQVLEYTARNGVPEHPLYAKGYASIGCEPCTRAIGAGEAERAGRWWWELEADKECGLHFSPDGRAERQVDVLLRDVLAAGA